MSVEQLLRSLPAEEPAPALRPTVVEVPGRARVLRLDGEIDLDQQRLLRRALERALRDAPARLLVLDLSRLVFCDVTGLNELLRAREEAEAAGSGLVLAGPLPQTARLLEATGTRAVFEVHDSVAGALAHRGRR
ncbi:STAS domain-containing protein [Kitasatospora fiedleri]|uniref:STAS domain-containing protein n=1 Tax=Kitasatospora fiedleri TaxID=2991545 RepID=UPI00249ABCF7|nr:STAS domain-containing protein [Kitasatospora fiedleri]